MEALFGLVSLVFLVGAVLGIFAFRKAQHLEKQLLQLRDEVSLLKAPGFAEARQAQAMAAQEAPKTATSVAEEPIVQPSEEIEELARAPELQPEASPIPPLSPPQAPAPKKRGFVDELGARWSVWVGGLALGLGAIFLLRYSIEAGVFSPGLRVALTVILGLAALAAGEWLGRSDPAERSEALRHAYIPGVLTAVGILALFGSVYSSYALYGFIGPTAAFGLMGLLSLGGLALGLRQGPALSGLGLAGSLVTPWLVSSTEPSYTGLYTYLLIVAAGGLVLARYRGWTWLSGASVAGGLAWALIGFGLHLSDEFWPWTLYLGGLAGLAMVLNATQRLPLTKQEPGSLQGKVLPLLTYGATGILLLVMLYEDLLSLRAFYVCLAAAAFGLAAAWHWGRLAGAALLSGSLAAAAILSRGGEVVGGTWDWPIGGIYIPSPIEGEWAKVFIIAAAVAMVLIGASAFSAKKHIATPGRAALLWSLTGTIFPLLTFACLWLMGAKGVTHLPFALAGAGLAGAFGCVVEWLYRSQSANAGEAGTPLLITGLPINVFAAASCFAVLFAFVAGLSGLPLTLALTAALPAIAFIATLRHIWVLRVACPVFGGILALHVLYSLAGLHDAVGPRILFNALWIYLALPAVAAGAACWLMAKPLADKWSQAMEALALAFTALFAVFQVRHYMNAGDLFAPELTLEELSLQILVSLCFSLGLSRIKGVGPRSLFSIAAMAAMGVSLVCLVFGNLISMNPFFNATVDVRGGFAFNSLLLAYLLPGLFLGAIAWLQQHKRPGWYLKTLGGVSLAAMIAYVTTMVRYGYHGGEDMALAISAIENTEQYAYSIVWLL
ncbi:MAG: DUF2339 domain-containing protein, partial [Rhizobiales bacterium]|nr:DUF2339 domain-containing protein [Hyphomicrobiales bacterium]